MVKLTKDFKSLELVNDKFIHKINRVEELSPKETIQFQQGMSVQLKQLSTQIESMTNVRDKIIGEFKVYEESFNKALHLVPDKELIDMGLIPNTSIITKIPKGTTPEERSKIEIKHQSKIDKFHDSLQVPDEIKELSRREV